MNTRRTGIVVLLAGMFAVVCMSSGALAAPSRASSQATRPAPQKSCPDVADLEAALKEHGQTEQTLRARIDDLVEVQKDLQERLQQLKLSALPSTPPPPPEAQPNSSFVWMLAGTTVFALALCVIFLLRMNRPKAIDEFRGQWEPAGSESPPSSIGFAAPTTGMGAVPYHQARLSVSALPDWDSASPALDAQSLKALSSEKNGRSRDSTIELAEIMLSFGRINSAAEALANFIENYPKKAFAPWLKLLAVYRGNGQRTEFDKIAQKLNKTFNVWTVDWDNFDDALAPVLGLETMPHIMERVQRSWGTRECQAYLQYLLCDTRDETRRGFPLATVEDVLCLNDILEYHLGPYTGPVNAFSDSLQDVAPVTETEDNELDSHAPSL